MTARALERPPSGLGLEDALARWCGREAYAAMREYWDARTPVRVDPGVEPPPKVLRHQEYARRRKPLEETLREKLVRGELAASVLPPERTPQTSRVIVHPMIFAEAEIAWELDMIIGLHLKLESPEIFEPSAIPLNVWDVPGWYDDAFGTQKPGAPRVAAPTGTAFRRSENYRHVELGGNQFALSVTQARIVRHLHQASERGDPWQSTRDLLRAGNSASHKLGQVFRRMKPHWKILIESNGKGMYRLRIESRG